MARLRLATVEYYRCAPCRHDYAGSHCPQCGERTPVLSERRLKSLLIVDQPENPLYRRQERWRCRSCKKLYAPPALERVFAAALRCRCGAANFTRADFAHMLSGASTALEQARRLVAALNRRKRCRQCGQPFRAPCWCPICWATTLTSSSDLPYRPTWVYVPTGSTAVALDQED